MEKLNKKVEDSIEIYIKKEVSTELHRNLILEKKEDKYCTDKVKLLTNDWILKYDIAFSTSQVYLYASVMAAKEVEKQDSIEINISEEFLEAERTIDEWSATGDSQEIIAYKTYEDLLLKDASKAVTAQYSSEILEQNVIIVNAIIAKDESLSHTKQAIMYARGKEY